MGRGLGTPKYCEEPGCEEKQKGYGMCQKHYRQWYRQVNETASRTDARQMIDHDKFWEWTKDTLGIQGGNTRKVRF